YLLDVVTQVPSLRVVNAGGEYLLTPREEQIIALVSEGLSNHDIARELRLSEHTVKKYMSRIFDKLGISTRVELVLYAVNHGDSQQAEWMAGRPSVSTVRPGTPRTPTHALKRSRPFCYCWPPRNCLP